MFCPRKLLNCSLCALALLAAGCGKTVLYSNVSERQANEMISLLRARNMSVGKLSGTEGTWTVTIAGSQFAAAVDILSNYGFPQDQFETLGKVFQKSGMVSSPMEERARFMYALSENLAENISHISGVVTARVNIVLPENNPYTDAVTPSSAAVFVAYRPGSSIEDSVRDIKYLITNSIEGLSYDRVSVALFPTPVLSDEMLPDTELVNVVSIRMTRASLWAFWGLLLIVALAATGAGFIGAKVLFDYLAVRHEEKQKAKEKHKGEVESEEEGVETEVEAEPVVKEKEPKAEEEEEEDTVS